MTPRTSSRRARALVVAGAVAAALGLGACSAVGDPSAAALVDGEVAVTQADVSTVVGELPTELTGGQPVPASQVLTFLAISDAVRDLAVETETGVVGEAGAREFLASVDEEAGREPGTYSEATLRLISTNLMLGQVQQDPANGPLVQEAIDDVRGRLEVNPRYGEVAEAEDQLVQPLQRTWLAGPGA